MTKRNFWLNALLVFLLTSCNSAPAATDAPVASSLPATEEVPIPSATAEATAAPTVPAEPADIIFYNGVVITVEKSQPIAEAVAVRNGLIQAVGSNDESLALEGPSTMMVDLEGKTLLPGFIEGHNHYILRTLEKGVSIEQIMDTMLSFGLTSVSELRADRQSIETLLQAEQEGKLRVRVNVFAEYNYGFLSDQKTIIDPAWHRDHDPILDPSRMLRIPGVKIFADGAGAGERGCPYYSFPIPEEAYEVYESYGIDLAAICGTERGDLYLTEAQLVEAIQEIQDRGYRAAFHSMGDASIDAILNALETVLNGESNAKYRHQIHHNSGVRPDQLDRYVQLDVIATVRAMFNTCDSDEYIALFGSDRYEWAINRYQLPLIGIHAIAEGDFARGDVNDRTRSNQLNPIAKLYGMVTHQQFRSDGSVCKPPDWLSKHQISVERALEMLTIEPAYAVSMEEYVGSVKPGKYADLVILSGNPLTTAPNNLMDLQVKMTMVNGKAEYCSTEYESVCNPVSTLSTTQPIGFHDTAEGQQSQSSCLADGWTSDPDSPNRYLKVRVMVDGVEVAQTTAKNYRADLETAGVCLGGSCSFSINLWDLISHNAEHSILIQAQDAQTGEWFNLEATPKTLNCTG